MSGALRSAVIAAIAIALHATARADDTPPFLGSWSNGRGETLTITRTTIQFADDAAVPYRDVTRATDGQDFELQITARGEINGFPGKTLAVHCEGGSMKITGYASHADYMQGGEVQAEGSWEKDSDEPDESD